MGKARYIYGKNSVKAMLTNSPERVFKVFLAEGVSPDKRLNSIYEIVHTRKIPMQTVPRVRLDQMLRDQAQNQDTQSNRHHDTDEGPSVHQGILASVSPKALLELPAFIEQCKATTENGRHPRVLLLDGVTDPRNFGAILRVADAAGIDAVIIPKQHSAGFGPAVSKTASGAEESVTIVVTSNLNNAIRSLKDAGFWIAGAASEENAVRYDKQAYDMPMALIMGSEDKGLASLVKKNCDFLLQIPMHGSVESLNVATATAVLLFEMVKSR